MICKERDKHEHPDHDKFSAAGAKAEEQMAFYLRRAFADSKDVRVFNDLRFADESDDAVQIDHLVLHPRGIILIESKSVTSEVRVNKREEWVRVWGGRRSGMPSPIQQTLRQAQQLKKYLQAYREQVRGKMILGTMQKGFGACPFDILVAISDTGVVTREKELPEVCKADQIVDRVREIVQRHQRAAVFKPLSLEEGSEHFTDEEIENITKFFLTYHFPLKTATVPQAAQIEATAASPAETEVPAPSKPDGLGICQKCGAQSQILWGNFGYYWKCPSCQTNMPIKEYCPNCRGKMKLRKDKRRFFKYCEACKTPESLYYEARG